MKRILCAVGVSLIGWQAWAGEVDDNLKKLEEVLQKAPTEQGKNTGNSEESEFPNRRNLSSIVPMLRANIARNDFNSTIQMLQQFGSASMLSADAQKACQELLSAIIKEQDARDKAVSEQFEKALKHAADAVKTAKTAADLDAVVTELGSLKNRQENRNYSGALPAAVWIPWSLITQRQRKKGSATI